MRPSKVLHTSGHMCNSPSRLILPLKQRPITKEVKRSGDGARWLRGCRLLTQRHIARVAAQDVAGARFPFGLGRSVGNLSSHREAVHLSKDVQASELEPDTLKRRAAPLYRIQRRPEAKVFVSLGLTITRIFSEFPKKVS